MEQETGLLGAVAAAGGAVGKAVGEMFKAEKRLTDTMAAGPAGGEQFQVSKETVLDAGKIIQNQVEALWTSYSAAVRDLRVNLNGLDTVNKDIAEAWNERLIDHDDSYSKRVEQYIDSLVGLVEQLRAAAKQYGHTDEDVVAAMGAAGASQR
ncbi:hypothetical protein B0I31_10575 [Saccharothrix carnea]|uniref:Uncharacterized protein n=1 Tax=Saccharothrix carnea TaxID=1280637 RepID=A0A2P8I9H5_SACCR|nr:hypothetical protein [Saccharothrix carnea]PSL55118.1 hypothetical protein B0I31_10575 [Saccharothrix carnea]